MYLEAEEGTEAEEDADAAFNLLSYTFLTISCKHNESAIIQFQIHIKSTPLNHLLLVFSCLVWKEFWFWHKNKSRKGSLIKIYSIYFKKEKSWTWYWNWFFPLSNFVIKAVYPFYHLNFLHSHFGLDYLFLNSYVLHNNH